MPSIEASGAARMQLSASLPSVLIQALCLFRNPNHFAYVDRAPERDVREGIRPVRDDPGLGINLRDEVVARHRRAV